MPNPSAIYNEVLGGILDRLPGGHDIYQQVMQSRGRNASTAGASQAVTGNAANASVENTAWVQSPGTSNIPFNAILDYFTDGGNAGNVMLREAIETEIEAAAIRHNLDPSLVRAVIRVESNYRHDVVSHAGAMGLMQLMPGTAASLGVVDPFDIRQNIDGGTRYLRNLLDMFDEDLDLALAAYNAGQGAVRRHGGIPPFAETQAFVPRVQQYMERYTIDRYRLAAEDSRFST